MPLSDDYYGFCQVAEWARMTGRIARMTGRINENTQQIRLRLNYDNHEQAWSAKIVEKPNLPFNVEPLSTKLGPSRPRTAIQF